MVEPMSEGYAALCNSAAAVVEPGRGLILARGRDSTRFLHNLTSNHIRALAPGGGCYAFLLNPQGRIQADLHVFRCAGHYLLDTAVELRDKVLAHLRRYIVADQVELEDATGGMAAVSVEGPAAAEVLARAGIPVPEGDYRHVEWDGATVAAVSTTGLPGFRIFLPAGRRDGVLERLGVPVAGEEDVRVARIENGRPRYGEDIFETSLAQETGQMHAVSFNKGCYLGQEIVERIRARGHVNRSLVRVEIEAGVAPAAGAKLTAGGAEAGEITSAAVSPRRGKVMALAYLRVPHNASGTELRAGDAAARVL
jgi:tRNA-modifying protein YgfZ